MSGLPEITPALPGDAADLARILGDWLRETGWMPLLHSRADDLAHLSRQIARGGVRVVWWQGRPAGFLVRQGEEISALYLAPFARRHGLGRALVAEAKAQAPRLSLWCFQANTAARAFWAAMGFAEAARTDGQDNAEGLPDIRLIWNGAA